MKKWKCLYIAFFLAVCLIPSVGMLFAGSGESLEKRTLREMPDLLSEEGLNTEWLSEMGDYFQEHFGFRNHLVTANAALYGKLLGTSVVPSVIQGKNGWLYYTDSLSDYQGKELLSDRSIFNLAHTLFMTQMMLRSRNVNMVFAAAPNKNTLYGENMPYYDSMKVSEEKNLLRLQGMLSRMGVNFVDLYTLLKESPEVLYHERDSHWNNLGAAAASAALLEAAGKEHADFASDTAEVRRDFYGDLDQMLYPEAMTPEDEYYFKEAEDFEYTEEVEDNFAPRIQTVSEGKSGSLVVYRDSFCNALLPFLAS